MEAASHSLRGGWMSLPNSLDGVRQDRGTSSRESRASLCLTVVYAATRIQLKFSDPFMCRYQAAAEREWRARDAAAAQRSAAQQAALGAARAAQAAEKAAAAGKLAAEERAEAARVTEAARRAQAALQEQVLRTAGTLNGLYIKLPPDAAAPRGCPGMLLVNPHKLCASAGCLGILPLSSGAAGQAH